MPLLGAHMSIAGGLHKAVEAAAAFNMETVQIFTNSPSQWAVDPTSTPHRSSRWLEEKEFSADAVQRFKEALSSLRIRDPIAHSSYLINMASPQRPLWSRSVDAMVLELHRADQLGIRGVVVHPGAAMTASESEGIRLVVRALREIQKQTASLKADVLLENTAGQGSCLGWKFEHLAKMIDGVANPDRIGVCIDTCHAFAAGYPLSERADYESTMKQLDSTVGLSRVRAMHLNDSNRELGSRVDRHDHIGRGMIGKAAFRNVLCDPRLAKLPMYLETPKGVEDGKEHDA
ncbi:MAG: hypothetical protein RIS70_2607, partial [Planctomycetota bacterium]